MIDTCPSAIHDPIDPLSRTTLHPMPPLPPRADSPPCLRRLVADLPLPCPAACLPLLSILPARWQHLPASARLLAWHGLVLRTIRIMCSTMPKSTPALERGARPPGGRSSVTGIFPVSAL